MEVQDKLSLVLYKSFFDASNARDFLEDDNNFLEKITLQLKWYNEDEETASHIFSKDSINLLSQSKLINIYQKNLQQNYENYNQIYPNSYYNNLQSNECNNYKGNWSLTPTKPEYNNSNSNAIPSKTKLNLNNLSYVSPFGGTINGYCSNIYSNKDNNLKNHNNYASIYNNKENSLNIMKNNSCNINSVSNIGKLVNNSNNKDDEFKTVENISKFIPSGKYTCRYDIQIENEKEFQVARKLIGSKAYLL